MSAHLGRLLHSNYAICNHCAIILAIDPTWRLQGAIEFHFLNLWFKFQSTKIIMNFGQFFWISTLHGELRKNNIDHRKCFLFELLRLYNPKMKISSWFVNFRIFEIFTKYLSKEENSLKMKSAPENVTSSSFELLKISNKFSNFIGNSLNIGKSILKIYLWKMQNSG